MMTPEEIVEIDKVARVYFDAYPNSEMVSIKKVRDITGIDEFDIKRYILFMGGDGYMKVSNKGWGDGVIYELTPDGYTFFGKTSYERELSKKENPNNLANITNNNFNGNFGNSNFQNGDYNKQEINEKTFWENPIVIGVGTIVFGLILAYIVYVLGWN